MGDIPYRKFSHERYSSSKIGVNKQWIVCSRQFLMRNIMTILSRGGRSNYFEEYKAKSFNDGKYSYVNRPWCRVGMLYGANIPVNPLSKSQELFTKGGGLKQSFGKRLSSSLYSRTTRCRVCHGTKAQGTSKFVLGSNEIEALNRQYLQAGHI